MGQHVTLNLGEQELQRAQAAAAELGVELETYLERLIAWHVAPANREDNSGIASMFGLIPASAGEPTDIARDKDRLIGEAVLKEHAETLEHRDARGDVVVDVALAVLGEISGVDEHALFGRGDANNGCKQQTEEEEEFFHNGKDFGVSSSANVGRSDKLQSGSRS